MAFIESLNTRHNYSLYLRMPPLEKWILRFYSHTDPVERAE